METIKFIVEIDEQYIRDHANPEKLREAFDSGSKNDFLRGLADLAGFGTIEKDIDAGITEFVITRETINPDANKIFEHVLGTLAVLSVTVKKDKEEEKQDEQ